jgi:hypothetical protein
MAGLLVGLGALTRYAFGWLIVPVAAFLAINLPRYRIGAVSAAVLAFMLVLSPWLARNYQLSGTLLGTAGYASLEEIYPLKSEQIERSLAEPQADADEPGGAVRKLMVNLPFLVQDRVLTLGGSWLTAFFLAGLIVPFIDPGRNRVRLFVVATIALWVVVEALGKTQLSKDSSVNGENLLVVAAPLVFIFGMAWFNTLLDQLTLRFFRAREFVTAAFLGLLCVPLIVALLPPRRLVHAFPPYHPLYIQILCEWLEKDETMMSDLPWASAWYGDRQCVWLPLRLADPKHEQDFYAIHDSRKPVRALHFSHRTLDQPMLSEFYLNQERGSWGRFTRGLVQAHAEIQRLVQETAKPGETAISAAVQAETIALWKRTFQELTPEGFPLRHCPLSYVQGGQLFLTDRDRWSKAAP